MQWIFVLFLSFVSITAWAQEGFFTKPQLFERQEVDVDGRLRQLILEDVSPSAGEEIVVLTRSGSYPNWDLKLSVFSSDPPRSRIGKEAVLDIPKDVFGYSFSKSDSKGWASLYYVYPEKIEKWDFDPAKKTYFFRKRWAIESGFHGTQKGQAIPLELLKIDGKLLVPSAHGAVLLDPASDKLGSEFSVPTRNFFRTGRKPLVFELPFWFRGVSYFRKPVLGNLPQTEGEDLIWIWMDEFLSLAVGNPKSQVRHFFNMLSEEERDDGQGYVVIQPVDLNKNGFTDFVVNKFKGAATSLSAETYLYVTNQKGELPKKGQRLSPEGNRAGGAFAIDLNQDGYPDIAAASAEFNVLSIVNALLRKKVSVTFSFYLNRSGRFHVEEADFKRETSFSFDLKQAQIDGLLPSLRGDFDGDGRPDALYARDRRALTVLAQKKGPEELFPSVPSSTYEVTVREYVELGDLNGDGLSDVVLFDRQSKKNRRMTVLMNTGLLKKSR